MDVLKIGLIGCGSIGTALARYADKQRDIQLMFISDFEKGKAGELAKKLKHKPKVVKGPAEMSGCDLVIEAASQDAVRNHAIDILDHSDLMLMSVGALADENLSSKVKKKAHATGRRVYMPSGAVAGLDALKSGSFGRIDSVTLTTRKPPAGLEGAPWIIKHDIGLRSIRKPTVVFEGTADDAARWFPKNINVSAALSLAGIGPGKTKVRIIADPFSDVNVHEVEILGSFGRITTTTENVPSPKNPKTSYLAALSAIATLDRIRQNVIVGT